MFVFCFVFFYNSSLQFFFFFLPFSFCFKPIVNGKKCNSKKLRNNQSKLSSCFINLLQFFFLQFAVKYLRCVFQFCLQSLFLSYGSSFEIYVYSLSVQTQSSLFQMKQQIQFIFIAYLVILNFFHFTHANGKFGNTAILGTR